MQKLKILSLVFTLLAGSMAAAQTSSELGGLKVRTIGPANMSGRSVDIAVVEKDPYIIYAATATGGVWRTKDNGVTWAPVFENEAVHAVGTISIFQPNPDILWIGTGERANRQSVSWGDGIYKSVDAGKSWTNVPQRLAPHRAHRHSPLQPGHGVGGGDGESVCAQQRAGSLQDHRRGQDLAKHPLRR